MLKIGLTGGIGGGKSAAADIFSDLGIPVIDTDIIAHQLTQPGSKGLTKIINDFGKQYLTPTGELDRKKLANTIFTAPAKKASLEKILHPEIKRAMLERIDATQSSAYAILVVPLLFETDYIDLVDRSLVIDAPMGSRIERIIRRDNISQNQARRIIDSQISQKKRLERADDIIQNTGSLADLRESVIKLHHRYLQITSNQAFR